MRALHELAKALSTFARSRRMQPASLDPAWMRVDVWVGERPRTPFTRPVEGSSQPECTGHSYRGLHVRVGWLLEGSVSLDSFPAAECCLGAPERPQHISTLRLLDERLKTV